jgi:hypothetical protein
MPDEPVCDHLPVRLNLCVQNLQDVGSLPPSPRPTSRPALPLPGGRARRTPTTRPRRGPHHVHAYRRHLVRPSGSLGVRGRVPA